MVVASALVIFVIAPRTGKAAATWNKGVQERVSLTSAVLGNMKEVKLLGLTDRWSEDIQNHRVEELVLSKKYRTQSVYRLTLSKYTFPCFLILKQISCGCLVLIVESSVDVNVFDSASNFRYISDYR